MFGWRGVKGKSSATVGYNASMKFLGSVEQRFLKGVLILSGLDVALYLVRVAVTGSWRYYFMIENLILAWLPLIFSWWLIRRLLRQRWWHWPNVILTVLWLVFLPNTWYVLSDYVHLEPTGQISELYDVVMIAALVFVGFILGFASLYIVHRQLRKRYGEVAAAWLIAGVLLLSSFAIYLGRDLRWTTLDIVKNPTGLILNVTDRLLHPLTYLRAFTTTGLFFVFLGLMYLAFWQWFRPPSHTPRQPASRPSRLHR